MEMGKLEVKDLEGKLRFWLARPVRFRDWERSQRDQAKSLFSGAQGEIRTLTPFRA